jgi:hypothetical protein
MSAEGANLFRSSTRLLSDTVLPPGKRMDDAQRGERDVLTGLLTGRAAMPAGAVVTRPSIAQSKKCERLVPVLGLM